MDVLWIKNPPSLTGRSSYLVLLRQQAYDAGDERGGTDAMDLPPPTAATERLGTLEHPDGHVRRHLADGAGVIGVSSPFAALLAEREISDGGMKAHRTRPAVGCTVPHLRHWQVSPCGESL